MNKFTATRGKKKLINLSEADAREFASYGGLKITGFKKKKCKRIKL